MGKIILVTGGARSGKSSFAEKLALKIGDGCAAYIATAQIFDDEMNFRVKLYQSRRNDLRQKSNVTTALEAAEQLSRSALKNFQLFAAFER